MSESTGPLGREQSIEALEAAVYGRQREDAGKRLAATLRILESKQGALLDGRDRPLGVAEEQAVHTRIAAAAFAWLADPQLTLSQPGYEALASLNAQLGSLIACSGFGGADHLWRILGTLQPDGRRVFDQHALRKGYALASLWDTPTEVVERLRQLPADIAAPALLGLLSGDLVLSAKAEASKRAALQCGAVFDSFTLTDMLAGAINGPWMKCSYSGDRGKHAIKRHLNGAVRRWMHRRGTPMMLPPPPANRGRPVLLVPMEYARIAHAMLRCYGASLAALRAHFRTVVITPAASIDDDTRALFDDAVLLDSSTMNPESIVRLVAGVAPDAVFFPSVGMSSWAIWMANLRLAPCQFMAFGHPASSMSDTMDFAIASDGITFDPAYFSERMVVVPGLGVPFQTPPRLPPLPERKTNDPVRIAVPAKMFKLSIGFLDACRRIADDAPKTVQFHFFSNERGILHELTRRQIESRMAPHDVVVHPGTTYDPYMAALATCDISLAAFNFGNSNGAADSLFCGLPIVALDGPEIHHGSDRPLILAAGLPSDLVVETEDQFVERVLELIGDDDRRVRITTGLRERTLEALARQRGESGQYAAALRWLVDNHGELRASGQRVIRAAAETFA